MNNQPFRCGIFSETSRGSTCNVKQFLSLGSVFVVLFSVSVFALLGAFAVQVEAQASSTGITSFTYTNSNGTTPVSDTFINSRTVTIEGSTVARTEYHLFVRAKEGDWPAVPTASGTSAADGSTINAITLIADGEYEITSQVRTGEGNTYVPEFEDFTVSSEFIIDSKPPRFPTHPSWNTGASQFSDGVLEIDLAEHNASPTLTDIFNSPVATDTDSADLTVAVATVTGGGSPSATCSDLSTYSYTFRALKYADVDTEGKTRVCARAIDGAGHVTYSQATDVLTVNLSSSNPPNRPSSLASPTSITLLPAHNSGSTLDTITNRAAQEVFTFVVAGSFTEDGTIDLKVTNPAGTTSTFTETVGSTETARINVDVTAGTFRGNGTYTVTATQTVGNSTSSSSNQYTITIDRINPSLTVIKIDGTTGIYSERKFSAVASDFNGIDKFDVAAKVFTCTAGGTSSARFTNYEENTIHTVRKKQDCFRAIDTAGNATYVSTAAAIVGVGSITYTNSDGTPAAPGNVLKTNTFNIAGVTAANTRYRLFVREDGARVPNSWPSYVASGTSASDGTLTETLTRPDGGYEVAFRVEVDGVYVPAILNTVSTFSIDSPTSSNDRTAPTFDLTYAGSPNVVGDTGYYNTSTLITGGVTVSNVVEENLATATLTLARTDTTGVDDLTPASAIHSITDAVSFANLTSVPDGAYTATVVLTDGADNQTTKTLDLVVDTATPAITDVTIDDPSARGSVDASITVSHNQTIQETLTSTLAGEGCTDLNTITVTGSGTSISDIEFRGRIDTFDCTITLADYAGNTSNSFTVPTFTIQRSSSGGGGGSSRGGRGGGVNPGVSTEAPTLGGGTAFTVSANPVSAGRSIRTGTKPLSLTFPSLFCGSQGERVRALQEFLNQNGYIVSVRGPGSPGQETTFFGPATERALKAYQAANGLPVTGVLDPQQTQACVPTRDPLVEAQIAELKRALIEILERIQVLLIERAKQQLNDMLR